MQYTPLTSHKPCQGRLGNPSYQNVPVVSKNNLKRLKISNLKNTAQQAFGGVVETGNICIQKWLIKVGKVMNDIATGSE
jgi:hypothetical protein